MNQAGAIASLCRGLAETIERIAEQAVAETGGRARAAEIRLPVDEFLALRPDFDAARIGLIASGR